MYSFRAGIDLSTEIINRHIRDRIDDGAESLRIAIGHGARIVLIPTAFAGNHICRNCPGRSSEAQQRRLRAQLLFDCRNGLVDRLETLWHRFQPVQCMIHETGREPWPFAFKKFQILPHSIGDDENIGKQDCAVEAEPADWLQGHFGGRGRIVDQFQKTALLCPLFAIFG